MFYLHLLDVGLKLQIEVAQMKREFESLQQLYAEKLVAREDFLRAEENYNLASNRL